MQRQEGESVKKVLIVVDMQNDFVDGALGTAEAAAIVEGVVSRIQCGTGNFLPSDVSR